MQKEKKSTDEFEVMLNNLSLEEAIALKLELAAKSAGGMLYGIPIWYSLRNITNDAVLKYAYSATKTKMEAARFLGFDKNRFNLPVFRGTYDRKFFIFPQSNDYSPNS